MQVSAKRLGWDQLEGAATDSDTFGPPAWADAGLDAAVTGELSIVKIPASEYYRAHEQYTVDGALVDSATVQPLRQAKTYNAGPCEQGQTAARTGCTPAGGGSGGGSKHEQGQTSAQAKPSKAPDVHPGAAHGSRVKVKPTEKRAISADLKPVKLTTKLTKQETGRVGEAVMLAWLRTVPEMSDAKSLNAGRDNGALDSVADSAAVEMATGLASNAKRSQQWRITFGLTGKAKKQYEALDKAGKTAFNANMRNASVDRKLKKLKELSKELGREIKPVTVTCVLNPDTRTADIFRTEGFQKRIGWSKAQRVASVEYEADVEPEPAPAAAPAAAPAVAAPKKPEPKPAAASEVTLDDMDDDERETLEELAPNEDEDEDEDGGPERVSLSDAVSRGNVESDGDIKLNGKKVPASPKNVRTAVQSIGLPKLEDSLQRLQTLARQNPKADARTVRQYLPEGSKATTWEQAIQAAQNDVEGAKQRIEDVRLAGRMFSGDAVVKTKSIQKWATNEWQEYAEEMARSQGPQRALERAEAILHHSSDKEKWQQIVSALRVLQGKKSAGLEDRLRTKASGPCQQGQTAARTGCTPASGEASGSSSQDSGSQAPAQGPFVTLLTSDGGFKEPEQVAASAKSTAEKTKKEAKRALMKVKDPGTAKQLQKLSKMMFDDTDKYKEWLTDRYGKAGAVGVMALGNLLVWAAREEFPVPDELADEVVAIASLPGLAVAEGTLRLVNMFKGEETPPFSPKKPKPKKKPEPKPKRGRGKELDSEEGQELTPDEAKAVFLKWYEHFKRKYAALLQEMADGRA